MRRRLLAIVFLALIAIAVPLGAAFSLDRGPLLLPDAALLDDAIAFPRRSPIASWPEAGTLMVTGGVLLGLASLVRRSA